MLVKCHWLLMKFSLEWNSNPFPAILTVKFTDLNSKWQRRKIFVLANRIIDKELKTFFSCPNKFLVFSTSLFVKPTKEFDIIFRLTKLFVRETKILLGQKKEVRRSYSFLPEYIKWIFELIQSHSARLNQRS